MDDDALNIEAIETAVIEGKKTRLRVSRAEEARQVYEWAIDDEIAPFWGGTDYYGSFEEFMRDLPAHYFDGSRLDQGRCLIIEAEPEGGGEPLPIGAVAVNEIDRHNRNTEFDVLIGLPGYRGRGYGTDALRALMGFLFETVGLHRVWVMTYEHNEPAQRSYEKVGFVREGLMRESDLVEGRWVNTIFYGLLAEEFDGK